MIIHDIQNEIAENNRILQLPYQMSKCVSKISNALIIP